MPDPSPISALRARLEAEEQAQDAYQRAMQDPACPTETKHRLFWAAAEIGRVYPREGMQADLRWCVEEIERLQAEVASLRAELEEEIREG